MKKLKLEQRSPEWEQLRKTHLTGTMVKSIMGTANARQDAFYEAIANRLTTGVESDDGYENPMDRGIRLEPDAVAAFEFQTGKSIESVGFCKSDENDAIAQSPDGYVKETNDTEAVEIKCMGGKNHVRFWLTNEIPKEYFWQVVQYFVVNNDLLKLHFVGYNPNIPVHSLHVVTVERVDILSFIVKSREEQEKFINEVNAMLSTIITI
jgi:putative phage-type endonuclease